MDSEIYDKPVCPNQPDEEKQFITELKNEVPGAFEKFFNRYWRVIMRLCLTHIQDPAEAEDAAIETFADAAKGLKKFRGEARLSSWLFRLALNRIFKHRRHQRNQSNFVPIDDCPENAALTELNTAPPEIQDLLTALNSLPVRDQLFLTLRYVNNLKLREIAEITGAKPGAVAMRLKRAEAKLRRRLMRREK
uniref:Sigma-70 family RNA polymerase sigma factor n=1 Tax=candidate division WOR-3 bacterium TaxID=2052148 RepID=A0A7V3UZ76_UNCW3